MGTIQHGCPQQNGRRPHGAASSPAATGSVGSLAGVWAVQMAWQEATALPGIREKLSDHTPAGAKKNNNMLFICEG